MSRDQQYFRVQERHTITGFMAFGTHIPWYIHIFGTYIRSKFLTMLNEMDFTELTNKRKTTTNKVTSKLRTIFFILSYRYRTLNNFFF